MRSTPQQATLRPQVARILIGAALGLIGAGMPILAFPPYSVWPLIFAAFLPMLLADYRVLPLCWAGLGSGLGIGVWHGSQADQSEGRVAPFGRSPGQSVSVCQPASSP